MDLLLVGVGSFAGGVSRYVVGRAIAAQLGAAFPWHTLAINVTGSLAIGLLAALLLRTGEPAGLAEGTIDARRLLVMVGFLGGYTTFSSFSLELLTLLREGRSAAALGYALSSTMLGPAACAAGYYAALRLSR